MKNYVDNRVLKKVIELKKQYEDRIKWNRISEIIEEDFNIKIHRIKLQEAYENYLKDIKTRHKGTNFGEQIKENHVYGDLEKHKKIKIEMLKCPDFLNMFEEEKNEVKFCLAGCFQIPFHSRTAVNLWIEFCKEYQPHIIIINGDYFDLYNLSRFTKNAFIERSTNVYNEMLMGLEIISELNQVCPKSEIIMRPMASNHEERWYKNLYNQNKNLIDFVYFENCLYHVAYENDLSIKFKISRNKVDYMGNCSIKHAGYLSKYGVMRNVESSEYSCMVNHSHKLNWFTKKLSDSGRTIHSLECGCMCKDNMEYNHYRQNVRGFSYGNYDLKNMIFNPKIRNLEGYLNE